MLNLVSATSQISTLSWIVIASVLGGVLSVSLAAVFALNVRTTWVPMLVSYAIGAMLGAVFLEILPGNFLQCASRALRNGHHGNGARSRVSQVQKIIISLITK